MQEERSAQSKEGKRSLAVFVQRSKCAHTITPEPYLQSYCSIFALVGYFVSLNLLLCESG